MKVQLLVFITELDSFSLHFLSECDGIIAYEGPELNQTIAFTS